MKEQERRAEEEKDSIKPFQNQYAGFFLCSAVIRGGFNM